MDHMPKRITQRFAQGRNKRCGNQVEDIAVMRLQYLGVEMVQRFHDLWLPRRQHGNAWICCKGKAKLAGDVWGVLPGGQMVICECKWRKPQPGQEARLVYSALETHQAQNLDRTRELGAVPLLFWHAGHWTYMLPWPLRGFGPRRSLRHDTAATADIKCHRDLMAYARECRESRVAAVMDAQHRACEHTRTNAEAE